MGDILVAITGVTVILVLFLASLHAAGIARVRPFSVLEKRFPAAAFLIGFPSEEGADTAGALTNERLVRGFSSFRKVFFTCCAIALGVGLLVILIALVAELL